MSPSGAGVDWSLRWWNPFSWYRVARRVREFDGVVVPWVTPFHALATRVVLRAGRVSIAIVHNPVPHERFPFARSLTRWVLRQTELCIVHGAAVESELRAIVPDVPTVRLQHPPNLPVTPTPLPPRPPVRCLFLGYVRPYKGVDLAIEAVARLIESGVDARLTVAGEAWMSPDELRRMRSDLGVEDAVDLRLRYMSDAEAVELLASHHLLVAPYRSGTVSGVIPLAIAAGRPVVAARVGSIHEAVVEGVTGSLFDPEDVAGLVEALRTVIDDLDELAQNTRGVTQSWSSFATTIASAIERAAER